MIFRYKAIIRTAVFLCAVFLVSSCKNTDPFRKEAQNSSLALALSVAAGFEDPGNEQGVREAYDKLSFVTKNMLAYPQFYNTAVKKFPQQMIVNLNVDFSVWEKYELKDGSALVYILKKYDYKPLFRTYESYAVLRLHLVRENQIWSVDIESPSNFDGFKIIESGVLNFLADRKIEELRAAVKADADNYQFNLDLANQPSHEENLAVTCVAEGEKLYDKEKYREALMQFQKALSIDPANEKAKTYIERCRKAISIGLGK